MQRLARLELGHFGDAKFFDGIGELRIDTGPGYRVYFVQRGKVVVILLCGGDKSSQARDIKRAKALAMEVKVTPFDAADYLGDEEAQTRFLADAIEEGDPAYVAHALGIVARARGMTKIAQDAGLAREALYRSLSAEGDPRLSTLFGVLKSLGVTLTVASAGARG